MWNRATFEGKGRFDPKAGFGGGGRPDPQRNSWGVLSKSSFDRGPSRRFERGKRKGNVGTTLWSPPPQVTVGHPLPVEESLCFSISSSSPNVIPLPRHAPLPVEDPLSPSLDSSATYAPFRPSGMTFTNRCATDDDHFSSTSTTRRRACGARGANFKASEGVEERWHHVEACWKTPRTRRS